MKKFKKIIATLLVVLSFATLLVGCSKKTECDICEEVKKCNSKKIMGEKIWICDDCQDKLDALGSLFNQFLRQNDNNERAVRGTASFLSV